MPSMYLLMIMFTTSLCKCDGAKILTIIPFPMKSHDIVYKPLQLELARRGHNVTAVGAFPTDSKLIDKKIKENFREIIYESEYKTIYQKIDLYEVRTETTILNVGWYDLFFFWHITNTISVDIYENPEVKKLIENSKKEKFDLIICEGFFGFESLFAFGELFDAPVIVVYTFGSTIYTNQHIGNPLGASYHPCFILPYTDKMNLIERLHNFVANSYVIASTYLFHLPNQELLIRKYFSDAIKPRKMPPLRSLLAETSLVFLNSHIVLGFPRPNLPNVIEIGGLHIQSQANVSLDKDLQMLMDYAKQGIIYFSLGSNVGLSKMPEKYVRAFVKAFSNIPQLVLWKWEDTNFPGQTKNVHVAKWYPQQQILAHKNCLAFITHGGMLSLEEAVFNGVPVIGIPFFGDQPMNMKLVEQKNLGIMLEFWNITYESLTWSLNEIITNKKYKETAKRLSLIFHDSNGGSPLDKAVYWVEYILRYDGAPHLRTEARLQPYYKYLLLDVILILIVLFLLFIFIMYRLLMLFFKFFHSIRSKYTKNKSD